MVTWPFCLEQGGIKMKKLFMKQIIAFIIMIIIELIICPHSNADFINGDMESWSENGATGPPDGWTLDPNIGPYITSLTATQNNTITHEGNYSAEINTTLIYSQSTTVGSWMKQGWSTDSNNWILIPGGSATVSFSGWLIAPSGFGEGGYGELVLMPMDADNNWLMPRFYSNQINSSGNWVFLSTGDVLIEAHHIVAQIGFAYRADGSTHHFFADDLTLTIVPTNPIPEPVSIDIIPKTCPNECPIKGGGAVEVAIHGTTDFDVTDIDIASIRLEGVAPVRSSLKDKSTPVSNGGECPCTAEGRDGFIDLCLKFDKKAIFSALGGVSVGDNFELILTGNLQDDGTQIEGQDCIEIVKKGGKGKKD
jgi:hypothetical protein